MKAARLAPLVLIACLTAGKGSPAAPSGFVHPATPPNPFAGISAWPFPPSGLGTEALESTRRQNLRYWINSDPLFSMARDPEGTWGIVSLDPSLKGKALLIHFWDYTNTHCLRLIPLLSRWHERYAKDGLVIVGVHAPEFSFSADPRNVARAVRRLGIRYPVYLDSSFLVWRLFETRYWPRSILIAPGGTVAHDQIGSGGTDAIERAVRVVLRKAKGESHDSPLLSGPRPEGREAACHAATRTAYCGFQRGRLGAPGYRKDGAVIRYRIPRHAEVRQERVIYLEGSWRSTVEALFTAKDGPWEMRLKYQASEVNLVLEPPPGGEPTRVRVTLDGKPVPAHLGGRDLLRDPAGESYLAVETPRMVNLIARQAFGAHEIGLFPERAGTGFYAFHLEGCQRSDGGTGNGRDSRGAGDLGRSPRK